MLKLEPREAGRILLPSPAAVRSLDFELVLDALRTLQRWRHYDEPIDRNRFDGIPPSMTWVGPYPRRPLPRIGTPMDTWIERVGDDSEAAFLPEAKARPEDQLNPSN